MAGISWDSQDNAVLMLNLGQGWTWEYFDTMLDSAFALIQEMPHRAGLIIRDEETGAPVPHGSPLAHFRRAAALIPPNAACICIVAGDPFTHALIALLGTFNRTVRERVAVVRTLDEARAHIAERRLKQEQELR